MSGPNNINRNAPVDPYNNMEDWLNDDYDSGMEGDPTDFTSDDYGSGYQDGQGYAPVSMSGTEAAEQIKTLFNQVKKDSSIPNVEKNKQLKELRALYDQARNYGRKPVPNAIMNELSAFEAGSISNTNIEGFDGDEEGGSNPATLKKDLNDYKAKIQGNPNLSETKKQQYLAKITQWLSSLDLKTLDAETIIPLFEEMKNQITQASAFSPAVQSLAEASGADAEEIQQAFEQKGLNPSSLPNPPTQKVLEVLASLSEELGGKLDAVKDAVLARTDEIRKQTDAANAQNASNTACSSDNDKTDLKAFQYLYDAKHHQDQQSKDVAAAMREAGSSLVTLLQAAYPGVNISTVSSSEGQGFNDTEKDYNTAGLINFNGSTIDIFKATDGKLQASSSVDTEPAVQIVGVRYDWEGSGDWEDGAGAPSLTTYGEEMQRSIYDNG